MAISGVVVSAHNMTAATIKGSKSIVFITKMTPNSEVR